jgi:hypothetical protein
MPMSPSKYGKVRRTSISIPEEVYRESERRARYDSISSYITRALVFYHSNTDNLGNNNVLPSGASSRPSIGAPLAETTTTVDSGGTEPNNVRQ